MRGSLQAHAHGPCAWGSKGVLSRPPPTAQGRVGATEGWRNGGLAQGRVMKSQVSERPRRATNLTIRRELVVAARQDRINLSALLERALEEELVRLKWRRWRQENAASIAAYNRHIKEHRPFSQILLRW
jgi:antitoxin CcdA